MRPGTVALLLAVQAAILIGGFALLLLAFADRAEQELDREVRRVERRVERDVDRLRHDVLEDLRRELDRRLPAAPAAQP